MKRILVVLVVTGFAATIAFGIAVFSPLERASVQSCIVTTIIGCKPSAGELKLLQPDGFAGDFAGALHEPCTYLAEGHEEKEEAPAEGIDRIWGVVLYG